MINFKKSVSSIPFLFYRARFIRPLIKNTFVGQWSAKLYYHFILKRQAIPKYINIEFTNQCNMKCVMCKNFEIHESKKSYIEKHLLIKLVKEVDNYGPCVFMLVKQGDALIHPEFDELIQILKNARHNHVVHITTNGLALNKKHIETILRNGIDMMNFSVDSIDPVTYKHIRGKNLNKIIDNIDMLKYEKKIQKKTLPRISVNMVVMKSNELEIEKAKQYWKKKGIQLTLQKANTWILNTLEDGNKKWINVNTPGKKDRYPCYYPFVNTVLNSDGTISICCGDWNNKYLIGDYHTQSLSGIWNGEKIKAIRNCHIENIYETVPICSECAQWKNTSNIFFPWQYKK